jgi:chlorinating enzyme
MTRLSAAQRDTFASQGYLSPLDGLDASEATEHCRQLEKLIAPTGDRPNGRLRNKPHLLLYWAACVVRDARIVDTVAELIGPDLFVSHSTLFVKAPHDTGYVAWHQDLAYWDMHPETVVTAWVALTDSTVANGCVRVVPGSHRAPMLPHQLARDPNNRLIRGQTVGRAISPDEEVCLELCAGQFSLHHGRLLHGSPANPSGALRAGLAVRYIPTDVRQGGPRHSATLVRGTDRFGHYDLEPAARFDFDPITRAWHVRSLRRYAAHVVWQTLRRPSLRQLGLIGRLGARVDILRALLG